MVTGKYTDNGFKRLLTRATKFGLLNTTYSCLLKHGLYLVLLSERLSIAWFILSTQLVISGSSSLETLELDLALRFELCVDIFLKGAKEKNLTEPAKKK